MNNFHHLTNPPLCGYPEDTKLEAAVRTVIIAGFFVPISRPYSSFRLLGSLKGIWSFMMTETVRETVRSGRPSRRGNSFGLFYCRNTKLEGGVL